MVAIFTGAGAGFERSSANLLGGAGQLGGGLLGRGGEGVSVNAFTGNLVVTQQDEFLVGRGPDVGISRTHNSLAQAADGDNGDQWQQSTHRRVFGLTGTLGTAGSTISRLGGDGAVLVYSWDDAADAYVSAEGAGAHDRLTHSAGEWIWTDGDSQVTETYSAHGTDNWRITAKTDRDGNALTFTYAGDKLDTVTTADGGWTQYVWAGNNITEIVTGYTDLATSTAETLTRTRYAYDASDRLVMVTTDLTPEDSSVADGATYVTSYTYDGASNRIASISQTDGSLITIAYDASFRVETLTQQVASGVTRTTSIGYEAGHTLVTGPDGKVTKLSHDAQGRLTGIELPPAATGAMPQTVGFSYDGDGNLASVTDGNGQTTSYQYDAGGNAILVTDANNNTIERTFDAANRLITERLLGSDKHNSSAAHYSQYVYDGEGHLRYAIDASGAVVEYEYSAAGELLREIAYPAHKFAVGAAALTEAGMDAWVAGLGDLSSVKIVEHTYDARGSRISSTSYSLADSAGQALSGSAFRAIYQTYDQAGRLVATHREGEIAQSYVYDGMGRLIASTDLNGGTTTIAFDDAGLQTSVTTASGYVSVSVFNQAGELVSLAESGTFLGGGTSTYGYDDNGRMRVASDASGRSSYFVYDHAGRKIADVDHLGGMVEYLYDQAGRIAAMVQRANAVSPASLALLADPGNGLELASFAPPVSTDDQWSFNIYDDAGRTIRSIDGEGGVAAFEYDQSDRLVKTTHFANALSAAALDALKLDPLSAFTDPAAHGDDAVSRLFYDEAGKLVGALDGEAYLTESVYDAAGQKIADIAYAAKASGDLANAVFGELRASVDASQTRISRYIHDGQGQLAYTLDPLRGLTSYAYDAAGNLVSQTRHARPVTPASFDLAGVEAAIIADTADRTSWTIYDDAGRLAFSIDAEGGVATFAYDAAGRMIRSVQFASLHGDISALPALSAMEAWAADTAQAGDSANRVMRHWYNERGDVIYTLDAENYVKGYTYDQAGRLLSESAWPEKVVANDATTTAQIASLAAAANNGSDDLIVLNYTYDGAGRLLTASDGAGHVTRYVYDAMGRRTDAYQADDAPGERVRTHYVYDNAGRLTEQHRDYDPGNPDAIDATIIYAYDGLGNRVAVTDAGGNTTTFVYDALGQVVQSTNALNGVTAYEYDAFGNVVKATDPRGHNTYLYYDRLGRMIAERDAEDYLTRTHYDRFGDVVLTERYALPVGTPAETGLISFTTDGVSNELPATPGEYLAWLQNIAGDLESEAAAAESHAAGLQGTAGELAQTAAGDAAILADLEAQLAALPPFDTTAIEAQRQAALASKYSWVQNRTSELNAQIAALPDGPEKTALQLEMASLQLNLFGLLLGIPSSVNWYTDYINDYYDAQIAAGGGALAGAVNGARASASAKPGAPANLLAGTPYDGVPMQQPGVQVLADPVDYVRLPSGQSVAEALAFGGGFAPAYGGAGGSPAVYDMEILVLADPMLSAMLSRDYLTDFQFEYGYLGLVDDHAPLSEKYRAANYARGLHTPSIVDTLSMGIPGLGGRSASRWSDGASISSASAPTLFGSALSRARHEWNGVSKVADALTPFGLARPMAGMSGLIGGTVDHLYPDTGDIFSERYRHTINAGRPFFQQIPSHGTMNMLRSATLESIVTGGFGRVATAGRALSIEAQFEQNSLRVANEAHEMFMREIRPGGLLRLHPKLSMEIQRGGFVDAEVRRANLILRDELGLDATTVRINQRLYAPDGKYTVPDMHFPQSGNSIDYSYALKTASTPQIMRIQQASPHGNIVIVPPSVIRPVYTLVPQP